MCLIRFTPPDLFASSASCLFSRDAIASMLQSCGMVNIRITWKQPRTLMWRHGEFGGRPASKESGYGNMLIHHRWTAPDVKGIGNESSCSRVVQF